MPIEYNRSFNIIIFFSSVRLSVYIKIMDKNKMNKIRIKIKY